MGLPLKINMVVSDGAKHFHKMLSERG